MPGSGKHNAAKRMDCRAVRAMRNAPRLRPPRSRRTLDVLPGTHQWGFFQQTLALVVHMQSKITHCDARIMCERRRRRQLLLDGLFSIEVLLL